VSNPAAVVPDLAGEIVARIEQLPKRDIAELGDGEAGRGFHLNADAAFGDAPGRLPASLPEDGIRGPRLAGHERDLALGQGCQDRVQDTGCGWDLP